MKDGISVVILVGQHSSGKSRFCSEFTSSYYYWPTNRIVSNIVYDASPPFIIIDTPGLVNNRSKYQYSWQGVFGVADIVVDFGGWLESEVHGDRGTCNPKYMTWSGDNQETMKRIQDYLQGKHD